MIARWIRRRNIYLDNVAIRKFVGHFRFLLIFLGFVDVESHVAANMFFG